MNLRLFDSHAHYDDSAFDADRSLTLASLPAAGVWGVFNPGCTVEGSRAAAALAERYPFVWCGAGVHPEEADKAEEGDLGLIASLASGQKTMAVGEIGLDYTCDVPRELQQRWFEEQLGLARDLKKPVVVHDREAHADTLALLRKYRPAGVVHCYSGSAEMAAELVKLGLYIGFTGVVTFKNARRAVEAVRSIPLERILIETDSPYMAPEPYRGRRCDSSMVERVLLRIAELKGVPPAEAAEQTFRNAHEVYRIPFSN